MTRLMLALGIVAFAMSPALAGDKKTTTTQTSCTGYSSGAGCAKRKLSSFHLSHPRKSDKVIRQLYISKGFGR